MQQKRLSKCLESLARRERRGSLPRVTSRHNHILGGKSGGNNRLVERVQAAFSYQLSVGGAAMILSLAVFAESRQER